MKLIEIDADQVTDEELQLLGQFVETLPPGQLRDALAYLHDNLRQGNRVVMTTGAPDGGSVSA